MIRATSMMHAGSDSLQISTAEERTRSSTAELKYLNDCGTAVHQVATHEQEMAPACSSRFQMLSSEGNARDRELSCQRPAATRLE